MFTSCNNFRKKTWQLNWWGTFYIRGRSQTIGLQEERGRWLKKLTFCKHLYRRKCKRRGVGGQNKPILVNVVCERPLSVMCITKLMSHHPWRLGLWNNNVKWVEPHDNFHYLTYVLEWTSGTLVEMVEYHQRSNNKKMQLLSSTRHNLLHFSFYGRKFN